jgi:uncharacterized protein YegP (UPF0339 family)
MSNGYKFDRYRDRAGLWRWRFVAPNGRTMADSGEGYSSLSACDEAIATVKAKVPSAALV